MSGESINFDEKKIEKSDFYKNKKIFNIDDIDVNKILVSKKEQYGKYNSFKYFIGYNDNDVIRPLCLEFLKKTGYIRKCKENKYKENKSREGKSKENITISLRVNDKQIFRNYNKIQEKIERLMSIDFESKSFYDDDDDDDDDDEKYVKTKIKKICRPYD